MTKAHTCIDEGKRTHRYMAIPSTRFFGLESDVVGPRALHVSRCLRCILHAVGHCDLELVMDADARLTFLNQIRNDFSFMIPFIDDFFYDTGYWVFA